MSRIEPTTMENLPRDQYLVISIESQANPSQPSLSNEIYLIDLNGLCFFCLKEEVDFSLSDDDDDDKLKRFQESWAYIKPKRWNVHNAVFVVRGEEKIDGEDTTTEICSKIPPMCISCSHELDRIAKCHERILEFQRKQEELKTTLSWSLKAVLEKMSSSTTHLSEKAQSNGLQEDTVNYLRSLRRYLPFVYEPPSAKDETRRVKAKIKVEAEQESNSSSSDASDEEEEEQDDNQVNSKAQVKIEAAEESNSTSIPITSEEDHSPSSCAGAGAPENDSISKDPEPDCEIVGQVHSIMSSCGRYRVRSESHLFQLQSQKILKRERTYSKRKRRQISSGAIKEPPIKRAKPFTENKCEICGEIVPSLSLYDHLYTHVGSMAYRCPVPKCGQAFASRYSVCCTSRKRHRLRCAVERRCETCGLDFKKLLHLGSHLRRHENESSLKIFNCPITGCAGSFTLKQSLEIHIRSHFPKFQKKKSLQNCSICKEEEEDVQTFTPEKLEVHLKKDHGIVAVVKCDRCPFVFSNKEDFIDHVVQHIKDGGVTCDMCSSEEVFAIGHRLRSHYFSEHQIGRQFPCELCGKILFSLRSLNHHIGVKHEGRPTKGGGGNFSCTVCQPEVLFKSSSSLETHNIKIHGAAELKCRFCEKTFGSRSRLVEHERYDHLGVKRPTFTCTICKSVFDVRHHLKSHMQNVHSSERSRINCSECEKTFKNEQGLKNHVDLTHRGMRHVCEICGKGFKGSEVLKHHMRIHTGERPFSCGLCGHKFRYKSALFNHTRGHRRKGDQFVPKKTFDRTPK